MPHIDSRKLYSSSQYDEYFCLKPPLLLWAAILFLSRSISLPLVIGLGNFAGVDAAALTELRRFWSLDNLLPSLLAAVLLYAVVRRVPTAPAAVRFIWSHGQKLLVLAAAIDFVQAAITIFRMANLSDEVLLSVGCAAIDTYFLLYLLLARRVKDAFAEFPAPLEAPTA
jgi:hypothetical protein